MESRVTAAIAGAIGGLAGTLAMNYAQRVWTLAVDEQPPVSAAGKHDARDWQERSECQNSNELAAQAIARATLHRSLTRRELSIAAPLVHFSFGAAVGALYGALSVPLHSKSGVALGIALWLAADEIAMPLMGLSRSTARRPLEMHVQSLASHLVYGTVTERVRSIIRPSYGEGTYRAFAGAAT
jgi:putative membrane protein